MNPCFQRGHYYVLVGEPNRLVRIYNALLLYADHEGGEINMDDAAALAWRIQGLPLG